MLRYLTTTVLNILFPPSCVGCGQDGTWVCSQCLSRIHPIRTTSPVADIDQLLCLGSYDTQILAAAVQQLKYQGGREIAELLSAELARRFPDLRADVIVPIPLHRSRERERGFNQAALLAAALGQRLAIPSSELVTRIRATVSQTTLGEEERRKNVADAFALAKPLETIPQHGILVDDVFTTGATSSAVARVLCSAGMKHITCVTVAKG